MRSYWQAAALAAVGLSCAGITALVLAQQPNDQQAAGEAARMALPTGNPETSVLGIQESGPAEVRVGEGYTYQLKVTNLTKQVTLHNVRVRQHFPPGLGYVTAEPKGSLSNDEDGDDGRRGEAAANGGGAKKDAEVKTDAAPKKDGAKPGQRQTAEWHLGTLTPGQTAVITVTAVGHEVGETGACVTASYDPALCSASRVKVVKAELAVSKEAPPVADLCDPFVARYVVRNTGQAVARGVVLTDDLGDGLKTADGKGKVEVPVGDLAGGAEKEVKVELAAAAPGEYTSRAVATADKVSSQSRPTTTKVTRAALQVELTGPDTANVASPAGYAVVVKNVGDAVARGTVVSVGADGERVRQVHFTEAGKRKDVLTWDLGDINPNEEKKVVFSLIAAKGPATVKALATTACGRANNDQAKAEGVVQTTWTAYPALRLEVVDVADPVKVGELTTYTIAVVNQGQAADQDVVVTADVPAELEVVKAEGTTAAKVDGRKVRFEGIKDFRPGARANWTIQVKAVKPGDLRTRVELDSKYLGGAVPDVEPTRAVK